jgi:hypothetical protein
MRTATGHYVAFNYDNRQNPLNTTCIIKGPDKNVVVEATVTRYYKDPCSKALARRFALQKALRAGNFTKEQRGTFWQMYRANVKA